MSFGRLGWRLPFKISGRTAKRVGIITEIAQGLITVATEEAADCPCAMIVIDRQGSLIL